MLKQILESSETASKTINENNKPLIDLLYYGDGVDDVQDYGKLGIMVEMSTGKFSDISEFLGKVENNFKVKCALISEDEITELTKLSHVDYKSNFKDILKEERLFLVK